jgi:hypothetical protein
MNFIKYLNEEAIEANSNSIGTEALGKCKKNDTVILKLVKGSHKDWKINKEEYEEVRKHIGKKAKVVDVNGFLLHLKFTDDFEISNVNDGQVEVI